MDLIRNSDIRQANFPITYGRFHDGDEIGPKMLARIAKHTGLNHQTFSVYRARARCPFRPLVPVGQLSRGSTILRFNGNSPPNGVRFTLF